MNKTKPPKVPRIRPYVDGKTKGYELDYIDIRSDKRKRFRIQGRRGIAEKKVISIYNEMMAYHLGQTEPESNDISLIDLIDLYFRILRRAPSTIRRYRTFARTF